MTRPITWADRANRIAPDMLYSTADLAYELGISRRQAQRLVSGIEPADTRPTHSLPCPYYLGADILRTVPDGA